jgi:hypothetical protein
MWVHRARIHLKAGLVLHAVTDRRRLHAPRGLSRTVRAGPAGTAPLRSARAIWPSIPVSREYAALRDGGDRDRRVGTCHQPCNMYACNLGIGIYRRH